MAVVANLGPASRALALAGGTLAGHRLVVATRNTEPALLVVYDLDADAVERTVDVPAGVAGWAMTTVDGRVLVGQTGARGRANVRRLDPATGRLEALAAIDARYLWDLDAAEDRTPVGVTADPSLLYAIDPRTELARDLGLVRAADRPRSVAATRRWVFVGGSSGGRAFLLVRDRAIPGGQAEVLPPALARDATVYAMAAGARWLALGTEGPGNRDPALALVSLSDLRAHRVARLPGEALIDTVAFDGDVVLATARRSGALYRWHAAAAWSGAGARPERLATPVPATETRSLHVRAGQAVGTSADGRVWRVGLGDATVTQRFLTDAGADPRPELAHGLAAAGGVVWVGGNFGVQEHTVGSGRSRRVPVPGEPKDLLADDDGVVMAVYPVAEVWRLAAGGAPQRLARLDPAQNRPASLRRWDGRLVVTTMSDRLGVGALHVVDGANVVAYPDPLGSGQQAAGLVVAGDTAYVGGAGTDADLAAWDLRAGRQRWRLRHPVPGAGVWIGLAWHAGHLVALSDRGRLLVVDPEGPHVLHTAQVADRGGRIVAVDGALAAATGDAVLRVQPGSWAVTAVVTGLKGRVWGWPFLTPAEEGGVWTMQGHDLVRVSLS
jgi:outer membrane protein assembly factor BamB